MTTALAHAAVEIVLLLSAGSFQAVLPQLSPTASPPFADTKEGAAAFIDWLKPQFPKGRWNPPPTQLCVVGLVPFAGDAFDVMFRANMRNMRLLKRWMDKQPRT